MEKARKILETFCLSEPFNRDVVGIEFIKLIASGTNSLRELSPEQKLFLRQVVLGQRATRQLSLTDALTVATWINSCD